MQYLLTEEEFKKLGPKSEIEKWKTSAQALATMVADHVPRKRADGSETQWKGCIITFKGGYCDLCPAIRGCPYDHKDFSK